MKSACVGVLSFNVYVVYPVTSPSFTSATQHCILHNFLLHMQIIQQLHTSRSPQLRPWHGPQLQVVIFLLLQVSQISRVCTFQTELVKKVTSCLISSTKTMYPKAVIFRITDALNWTACCVFRPCQQLSLRRHNPFLPAVRVRLLISYFSYTQYLSVAYPEIFFGARGFNKFSWGQRTERTGIWGW